MGGPQLLLAQAMATLHSSRPRRDTTKLPHLGIDLTKIPFKLCCIHVLHQLWAFRIDWAANCWKYGLAIPVARGVTPAGVTLRLRRQACLIEARGMVNGNDELGWSGPVDTGEGVGWAGLIPGPSIKVMGSGAWAGPGPVDKSERFGRRGWGQPIEVRGFGVTGPGPAGPPSLANPHLPS